MFANCFFPQCINPGGSSRRRRERAKHLLAPPVVTPCSYSGSIPRQFSVGAYASIPHQFLTAQSYAPETAEDFYSCAKVLPSTILSQDGEVDDDEDVFGSPPQTPSSLKSFEQMNGDTNDVPNGWMNGDISNGSPAVLNVTSENVKPAAPTQPTILINGENLENNNVDINEKSNATQPSPERMPPDSRKLYKEELNSPSLVSIPIYDSDQQSARNLTALQQDPHFVVSSDKNGMVQQNNRQSKVTNLNQLIVDSDVLKFSRDSTGKLVELGRGAYGQVMLGVYKQYSAAIKVFVSPRVTAEDVYREADALHHLQGTGVVPKFFGLLMPSDTGPQLSDRPAIVMERISSSVTFHSLISSAASRDPNDSSNREGPSRAQWLHIAVQLAAAVELLHRKNVLYNDLKMDNILVQMRARGYRIYLADLGDASGRKGLLYDVPIEQINGKKKHAYNHLAPEVLMKKATSLASDVYSLGVALVHLMRVSGTSDKLKRVVRLCLAVDPEDRPSAYIIRLKCADILAKDTSLLAH